MVSTLSVCTVRRMVSALSFCSQVSLPVFCSVPSGGFAVSPSLSVTTAAAVGTGLGSVLPESAETATVETAALTASLPSPLLLLSVATALLVSPGVADQPGGWGPVSWLVTPHGQPRGCKKLPLGTCSRHAGGSSLFSVRVSSVGAFGVADASASVSS
eukprot:scaffold15499_cov56-Phaeocystis_antarctica.AAC.3